MNCTEEIEIYKKVLSGELKTFPKNIWNTKDARQIALACFRYYIEEYLKLNEESIKKEVSSAFFLKSKLRTPFDRLFKGSPYEVINALYPNKYKVWEIGNLPRGLRTKETAIQALKWLIEEKYHWNEEQVKENLNLEVIRANGLASVILYKEGISIYEVLNEIYPNTYKPWYLDKVPKGYWLDKQNVIDAVKWLIEEEMQWSEEEVYKNFRHATLTKYNLDSLLCSYYNSNKSLFSLLNLAYPNKFDKEKFHTYMYQSRIDNVHRAR